MKPKLPKIEDFTPEQLVTASDELNTTLDVAINSLLSLANDSAVILKGEDIPEVRLYSKISDVCNTLTNTSELEKLFVLTCILGPLLAKFRSQSEKNRSLYFTMESDTVH